MAAATEATEAAEEAEEAEEEAALLPLLLLLLLLALSLRADMVKLVFGLRELNQRIGSLLIVILDMLKGRKSRDSPC